MKDGWQELCETCLRERTIVALSSQGQSDGAFYCGFVQEVTDDSLLLVYVNQLGVWGEGSAEGAWFQFQEIDWIKFGTPYLRALEKLIPVSEEFAKLGPGRWSKTPRGIRSLCKTVQAGHGIVEIVDSTGNHNVKVQEVHQHILHATILEDDGQNTGQLSVRYDTLIRARSGNHQAALAYLNQLHADEGSR